MTDDVQVPQTEERVSTARWVRDPPRASDLIVPILIIAVGAAIIGWTLGTHTPWYYNSREMWGPLLGGLLIIGFGVELTIQAFRT